LGPPESLQQRKPKPRSTPDHQSSPIPNTTRSSAIAEPPRRLQTASWPDSVARAQRHSPSLAEASQDTCSEHHKRNRHKIRPHEAAFTSRVLLPHSPKVLGKYPAQSMPMLPSLAERTPDQSRKHDAHSFPAPKSFSGAKQPPQPASQLMVQAPLAFHQAGTPRHDRFRFLPSKEQRASRPDIPHPSRSLPGTNRSPYPVFPEFSTELPSHSPSLPPLTFPKDCHGENDDDRTRFQT
jgi:hypothetical protein